jgi:hypothetical protein
MVANSVDKKDLKMAASLVELWAENSVVQMDQSMVAGMDSQMVDSMEQNLVVW